MDPVAGVHAVHSHSSQQACAAISTGPATHPHPAQQGGPHPAQQGGPHPAQQGGLVPRGAEQAASWPRGQNLKQLRVKLLLLGKSAAMLLIQWLMWTRSGPGAKLLPPENAAASRVVGSKRMRGWALTNHGSMLRSQHSCSATCVAGRGPECFVTKAEHSSQILLPWLLTSNWQAAGYHLGKPFYSCSCDSSHCAAFA